MIDRAFAIYRQCYTPTDPTVFEADFLEKSYAVLISHRDELVGFSTAELLHSQSGARVIFSGDTVTHPDHWGSQALPISWLKQAGLIWCEAPEIPLYWMLSTKGHRTY